MVRFQGLPARTGEDIPLRVVAELILVEEATAHSRPPLRLWDMRGQARLIAGHDILDLEVATVGDNVDPLDAEDGAGGFSRLLQQAHVDDLVSDFLLDDQLILGVDRELRVVTDRDSGMTGHRPAIAIGQRYLALASSFELRQQ